MIVQGEVAVPGRLILWRIASRKKKSKARVDKTKGAGCSVSVWGGWLRACACAGEVVAASARRVRGRRLTGPRTRHPANSASGGPGSLRRYVPEHHVSAPQHATAQGPQKPRSRRVVARSRARTRGVRAVADNLLAVVAVDARARRGRARVAR